MRQPFTAQAYKDWRKEQQAAGRAAGRFRSLPDYSVFWARYGSWRNAKRVLLPNPDEPDAPSCAHDETATEQAAVQHDGEATRTAVALPVYAKQLAGLEQQTSEPMRCWRPLRHHRPTSLN